MKEHHDVWDRDVEQVLISETQLDETVSRMAAQIDADYKDKNLPCFYGGFDEKAFHPL